MEQSLRDHAIESAPFYITHPGQTDYLFIGVIIFLVVVILFVGNLYFQLHALPERMSHHRSQVQMEIVAVLALIGLFTHNHAFWIAALLLALIDIPNLAAPLFSIAESLEKIARGAALRRGPEPEPIPRAETPALPVTPVQRVARSEAPIRPVPSTVEPK